MSALWQHCLIFNHLSLLWFIAPHVWKHGVEQASQGSSVRPEQGDQPVVPPCLSVCSWRWEQEVAKCQFHVQHLMSAWGRASILSPDHPHSVMRTFPLSFFLHIQKWGVILLEGLGESGLYSHLLQIFPHLVMRKNGWLSERVPFLLEECQPSFTTSGLDLLLDI